MMRWICGREGLLRSGFNLLGCWTESRCRRIGDGGLDLWEVFGYLGDRYDTAMMGIVGQA
jgi:hypothetical protein